jgi:hypothetical protein
LFAVSQDYRSSIHRPVQDLAPLLKHSLGEGAATLSWTYSIGASIAILLPMTNVLRWASSNIGDCVLAGTCALSNALLLACLPWSSSVSVLYIVVSAKAVSFALFDPAKKSYLNSLCKEEAVGAFMGWQHSIKGNLCFHVASCV